MKPGIILFIIVCIISVNPAYGTSPETARDFLFELPLFSESAAWNQRADNVDVTAESDLQITELYRVLCGDSSAFHSPEPSNTRWPGIWVNCDDWSVPISGISDGQFSILLQDYEGNIGGATPKFTLTDDKKLIVPKPAGSVRPAGPHNRGSDGHLVLYDSETCTEYDFWQLTTAFDMTGKSAGGGQMGNTLYTAGAADCFSTKQDGSNPDGYSSARAVGTPLLAGLIIPEDIKSGSIDHALAFAVTGLRNLNSDPSDPLKSDYFYPASTTETDYYSTSPHHIAAGQRIRLKNKLVDFEGNFVDESELSPVTVMFLQALRNYGAYAIDSSDGFCFYAEDPHTANFQISDENLNILIGNPPENQLPPDKNKWQILIEKLNSELDNIPFAYGTWGQVQAPEKVEFITSNFEVIESAIPKNSLQK